MTTFKLPWILMTTLHLIAHNPQAFDKCKLDEVTNSISYKIP